MGTWLRNVRIEKVFEDTGDGVITLTEKVDVLIEGGIIKEIKEQAGDTSGHKVLDGKGYLLLPSLVDNHLHLDKGHYGGPWKAATPFVSVADRIREEERFLPELAAYTKERAQRLIDLVTGFGVTRMRIQVNADPVSGIRNLLDVREVLDRNSDRVSYELVAFPQHGLLRGDSLPHMREAWKNGATVVGGLDPATIDLDLEKSLRTTFDLAREFNAKVDIHLHDRGSLGSHTIRRICHYTKECGLTGGVHISHAYSLGDVSREEARELAKLLASVDIGINTTSPIDAPAPPIPILKEEGVRVSIINDNINDHWSPFGTGDLLQRASRAAEKFGAIDEVSLAGYLGHVTGGKTPLDAQGNQVWPKPGDRADFLLVDASCSAEAVARVPSDRVVMKDGVVTSGKL